MTFFQCLNCIQHNLIDSNCSKQFNLDVTYNISNTLQWHFDLIEDNFSSTILMALTKYWFQFVLLSGHANQTHCRCLKFSSQQMPFLCITLGTNHLQCIQNICQHFLRTKSVTVCSFTENRCISFLFQN